MRRGLIVTLALAGLLVAVGLTLAASSMADQGLPAEGHIIPMIHLELGPSPFPFPSSGSGNSIGSQVSAQNGVQNGTRRSQNQGKPSPTPSPLTSRYNDDHGNPGSDD
jgi:hypothetical protein